MSWFYLKTMVDFLSHHRSVQRCNIRETQPHQAANYANINDTNFLPNHEMAIV